MKELSKQEWMEFRVFPLNEAYKLLILQVYSGIKNSANFDGVSSGDTELCRQIVAFLESLGIYFHVLHKNDKLKIIFGNRKADVRMLCALQDKVFNENRWHYEYGRLLGYPLCCIRQFIYRKGSQKSFIYTSTRFQNDPERGRYIMDYKLNILANIPLIFHMPCTPDCTASRILAGKVLKLYHDYSPVFIKQIVRFLRQPALVFNTENYVRLNGKFAGNKIRYCGIEHVHYPYFADGNKRFENIRINQLVKTLSKGNILVFDAVAFSILDNKDLLVTVEYRNFPFQVYDFR